MVCRGADIPAIVQKAKPAVVEILTFDQQNKLLKTGTGFFISAEGLLLTNHHVISGGSSFMAKTPTGAVYFLKSVVFASESYDVAELQFFATDVSHLTLGSSLSAVEGQRVLVIGNPEGLEGTVSDGIISAFRAGRTMIQITAPVSPGSSGSPVLDESGNVIGIATQVSKQGQNLNFAISAETIRDAIAKSTVISPSPPPVAVETPTPSTAGRSAEDYFNRAFQEVNNGNHQSGIADFTEAIRLKPTWAEAYYNRGFSFYYLKRYVDAIADYTEAIRLKPDLAIAYCNRGIAYEVLSQFDKAINDINEAIRLKPDDANSFGVRGTIFMNLKQYGNALSDFTEAIRLKPNLAAAYEDRAFSYDKLGKSSKAAQDRKKAKELRAR
jgi:Flp pilus assembly protein TadD